MAPSHIVMCTYEGYTAGWTGSYTNTLIAAGCHFTNYSQIDSGGLSEPCYIQFSSGSDQGMTTDNCPQSTGAENLWHEMQVAGKSLVGYFEDMPSVGYTGCSSGTYYRRHNPFIQFTNITDQSINVPYGGGGSWPGWNPSATDYSSLPLFTFLKANGNDDGHDGSMSAADSWIQSHCDNYIQWAKTNNSLFIIIADDPGSAGLTLCIIVGQGVTPGTTNNQASSHGSMANTLAGLLGVAPFPGTPAALTGWYSSAGGTAPAVVTGAASSVAATSAALAGTVNPEGQAATWQFQYGATTTYGSVSPASPGSAGSGTTAVTETVSLTGLAAGTTYHYRLSAANATGTSTGSDATFTTTGVTAPVAVTGAASAVTATSAALAGTVNPGGQAATWQFQYGTTTAYGSLSPASPGSAGAGTAPVAEGTTLTGLAASTTYHYRLSAANATGTSTGSDATFTSAAAGGGGGTAYSFTIEVTDSAGNTATRAETLTVNATASTLAITTASLPGATQGTAYTTTLTAGGGSGAGYSWSVSGLLPAGLSLNSSSGVIAGTPTAAGTSGFSAGVTDSAGNSATKALSIAVAASGSSTLTITTTTLAAATAGTAYSGTLTATGGSGTYTWAITSGSLPAGLSLSSAGVISGTPSAAGTGSFTAQVTASASAGKDFMAIPYIYPTPPAAAWATYIAGYPTVRYLVINVASGPGTTADANFTTVISNARAAGITCLGYIGSAYGATALATMQSQIGLWNSLYGITSILFDETSPSASEESYYTTACGYVTGTKVLNFGSVPDQGYAAIGDILLVFENAYSAWSGFTPPSWFSSYPASKFGINVYGATQAQMNTVISQASGYGIGMFFVTDENDDNFSALPSYLSAELSYIAGLAGTPATASKALSLTVNSSAAALTITTATLPAATAGTAYSATLTATGGSGTGYTWAVTSGTLPAGISLNASTGLLSGTPTTAGSASLTFRVTDSAAHTATAALTLTVSAASGGTSPVGPTGTWTLVFNDEFPGTSLNTSNWTALANATVSGSPTNASAVSVSGGYLRIGYEGAVNSNPASGYAGPSSGPAVVLGNCVEASISFPGPSGDATYNWPAWWCDASSWPAGGEEDIFEGYDGVPSALNYHSPSGANNGPHPSGSWCNSFHTYTLVRGSSTLSVWWDGVLVRSVSRSDNGAAQAMIINLAPGGGQGSSSAVIQVAYVRMWTPG